MISFSKYQGAGNDFILIDDRQGAFPIDDKLIQRFCHRQYGIGADGLILLQTSQVADLRMRIFNADGTEAEMCGNGIRCLFHFAHELGLVSDSARIETLAAVLSCALHDGQIGVEHPLPKIAAAGVALDLVREKLAFDVIDSGVPHAICFVPDIRVAPVEELGREVREHPHFAPRGVNVTFVQPLLAEQTLYVRTYERGVEKETLACGTAAVAAAYALLQKVSLAAPLKIVTQSREIFTAQLTEKSVYLKGPSALIFKGKIEI